MPCSCVAHMSSGRRLGRSASMPCGAGARDCGNRGRMLGAGRGSRGTRYAVSAGAADRAALLSSNSKLRQAGHWSRCRMISQFCRDSSNTALSVSQSYVDSTKKRSTERLVSLIGDSTQKRSTDGPTRIAQFQ
jgi:hypothetical protein